MVVRVGVGVIVWREGKILLGERIGAHGAHTWALPGGHLEMGESLESCARRELLEETGLTAQAFEEAGFTNDIFQAENKHYITLFMKTECATGQLELREPHQCKQWDWFSLDQLPSPLFLPLVNYLQKYHGRDPSQR